MADCRLLPWFYSQLDNLVVIQEFVPPPGKHWSQWIKKHNVAWLKSHGLKQSGNSEEVKARVEHYMDKMQNEPDTSSISVSSDDFGEFITLFVGVVGRIMCDTYTAEHIEETEKYIHNFLTKFKEIDKGLGKYGGEEEEEVTGNRKKSQGPRWLRSYNGVSLLNIPQAMRDFGPLVDLFEGKVQGEGIVTYIRPFISQGLRQNWASNALKSVYRNLSLLRIRTAMENDEDNLNTSADNHVGSLHEPTCDIPCVDQDYKRIPPGLVADLSANQSGNIQNSRLLENESDSDSDSPPNNSIMPEQTLGDLFCHHVFSNQEKKMFHVYKDVKEIIISYGCLPLSVVIYHHIDGSTFHCSCHLQDGRRLWFLMEGHQYDRLGLGYYIFTPTHTGKAPDDVSTTVGYGLLLPPLFPKGLPRAGENMPGPSNSKIFTLITSQWKVLKSNRSIQYL